MIIYYYKKLLNGKVELEDASLMPSDYPDWFKMQWASQVVCDLNETALEGEKFFWSKSRPFNEMRVIQ